MNDLKHNAEIISTFLQFILVQSQKEYVFKLEEVKEATINNNSLYLSLYDGSRRTIQLFG